MILRMKFRRFGEKQPVVLEFKMAPQDITVFHTLLNFEMFFNGNTDARLHIELVEDKEKETTK